MPVERSTITYGVSGHLVTAQSTPGLATFTAKEAYNSGGTLTALSSSPKVTVAKTLACSGSVQTVTLPAHSSLAFSAVAAAAAQVPTEGAGTQVVAALLGQV